MGKVHQFAADQLHVLSRDRIGSMLPDFLCDDSRDVSQESSIVSPEFVPDSFTIQNRIDDPSFLPEDERDTWEFLRSDVAAKMNMMVRDGWAVFDGSGSCIDIVTEQLVRLLQYDFDGRTVASRIYNQELTDVSRRVIAFCLYGNPNHEVQTHAKFNALGLAMASRVIMRYLIAECDLKRLLLYSIASGLVGLDLKGATAASSSLTNSGIQLQPWIDQGIDLDDMVELAYNALFGIVDQGLCIDASAPFFSDLSTGSPYHLLWFTDDVIETVFDLLLVWRLLETNRALRITLAPKNGQHGNDASYQDVLNMLRQPVFNALEPYLETAALTILDSGPRMGTINLHKLSPLLRNEMNHCNGVYIKGCRSHEMAQGGLSSVSYTSFVVARTFTESETGLDARSAPLVFIRSEPGEYAYWGFQGQRERQRSFSDGRRIPICYCTLEEHEQHKATCDLAFLTAEINRLSDLCQGVGSSPWQRALDRECVLLVDQLSRVTTAGYDSIADEYASLRKELPRSDDIAIMDELLDMARARAAQGVLGDNAGKLWVLDVGTAHGRDLRYLSGFDDVVAKGIDNARAFIGMLRQLEQLREIPPGSFSEMDMRDMSLFAGGSFDVVRHNATLLHLPVLPNGIGSDEAIAESYRVLRSSGLLYVSVKAGSGFACDDTMEGLGKRAHQYYSEELLINLLERNGFRVLDVRTRFSSRPSGELRWLLAFAEKPRTESVAG